MDLIEKPSIYKAFLAGATVVVPVFASATLDFENLLLRFLIIIAWLLFITIWFAFVLGPGYWGSFGWFAFGWIPNDGITAGIKRSFSWLIGAGLGVGLLEIIHAI
jgi:hypothetical protein